MKNINKLSIYEKMKLAEQGRPEDLDVLIHDKDWRVRREVARYGRNKDLDILVHDEDSFVRGVAKKIQAENLQNKKVDPKQVAAEAKDVAAGKVIPQKKEKQEVR